MGSSAGERTVWLLVVLCVALVAAPAGATGAPAATLSGDNAMGQEDEEIEADFLRMEIELTADGDSEWTVLFQQILDDDAEVEAFEDLQEEIETDPEQFLDGFEARMIAMVADASEITDREMELGEVSIRTEQVAQPQGEVGNVIFEFEWRGFAATDGERILAGDVLSGLPLDTNEVLDIEWSDEYELDSHTPAAETVEDNHLTWRGPIAFSDEEPRLSLTPTAAESDDNATDGTMTDTGKNNGGDGLVSTTLVTAGTALLVGVVLVGAGVVAMRRREPAESADGAAERSAEETPAELLSPEERVLRLLREHDGRMKQKQVTERTGWSDSRTSQVVGELRNADEIESFRIGRENVLTLPDVDIEADGGGADEEESDR